MSSPTPEKEEREVPAEAAADKQGREVPAEAAADTSTTQSESTTNGQNTSLSPLEEKIVRQIEYYFGDRNMPRDKFLQQAANSGEDGYVPIATLLTFNRLKALSSNEQLIASAVKKSNSSIIQLSDDEVSIRRHPDKPLPDIFSPDLRKVIKSKTVYVKGFPENCTLDKLQSFFDDYGKVENVQMRRKGVDEGRQFKGSVFVEFSEQSSADTFIALQSVKFEETELLKEFKDDYYQRKNKEKKLKKADNAVPTEAASVETPKPAVVRQKGCVLHFKGCGANPTWEAMKESLSEYATVAFVDFSSDRSEGHVRFKEEGGAEKALEGLSSGLSEDEQPQLLGAPSHLRVLQGEEEEQYWAKMEASKRSRGAAGKGHGGQKRKHKHFSGQKPPPAKQPKTED